LLRYYKLAVRTLYAYVS